jgi:hypothetical protein
MPVYTHIYMKPEDRKDRTRTNKHKTDTDEDKFDRYLDSIGL